MHNHLFATAILAVLSTSVPATAQSSPATICGQRDQIVQQLETRFGESVRSVGLAGPNRMVEVFASDETGSWTITVTSANGLTCLMAAGRHFEAMAPASQGDAL
jgi:hypothetical protein